MLSVMRRILGYQMTLAQWACAALLASAPYLAIGVVWALADTDRVGAGDSVTRAAAILGEVLFWPLLLLSQVCAP